MRINLQFGCGKEISKLDYELGKTWEYRVKETETSNSFWVKKKKKQRLESLKTHVWLQIISVV